MEAKGKWERRGSRLALSLLIMCGVYTLASYTYPKQDNVVLEYDMVKGYQIMGDSIGNASPCKVIHTTLEYSPKDSSIIIQLGDNAPIIYTEAEVTGRSSQLLTKNMVGGYATFTRVAHDSILVILEQPYFIILSKGNKCINFEELPLPN